MRILITGGTKGHAQVPGIDALHLCGAGMPGIGPRHRGRAPGTEAASRCSEGRDRSPSPAHLGYTSPGEGPELAKILASPLDGRLDALGLLGRAGIPAHILDAGRTQARRGSRRLP